MFSKSNKIQINILPYNLHQTFAETLCIPVEMFYSDDVAVDLKYIQPQTQLETQSMRKPQILFAMKNFVNYFSVL